MISADDVWPIVQQRLGLTDDSKKGLIDTGLIDTYIAEIGLRIQHYCNIRNIPDALLYTWASMVIDAVRVDQAADDQIAATVGGGGVTVKIGDTSVTSGGSGGSSDGLSNTGKSVIDQIVLNYRVDLNRYRRMRW